MYQEGLIAYRNAKQKFDPSKEAKLKTFANKAIEWRFLQLADEQKRKSLDTTDCDDILDNGKDTTEPTEIDLEFAEQPREYGKLERVFDSDIVGKDQAVFKVYSENRSYKKTAGYFGMDYDIAKKMIDRVKRISKKNINKH